MHTQSAFLFFVWLSERREIIYLCSINLTGLCSQEWVFTVRVSTETLNAIQVNPKRSRPQPLLNFVILLPSTHKTQPKMLSVFPDPWHSASHHSICFTSQSFTLIPAHLYQKDARVPPWQLRSSMFSVSPFNNNNNNTYLLTWGTRWRSG